MAHCPFPLLSDLNEELESLRALPKIQERKPGIFYLKSQGFLHFHVKGEGRWADVRDGKDWGAEIPLPFFASKKERAAFLAEVRCRYERTLGTKK